MPLTLSDQLLWNLEANPIFWLFGEGKLNWNADLIVSKDLIEVLLPAFLVVLLETQFLHFLFVLFKEVDGV